MKFLADMGISPRTVAHLRRLGHDAVHLHDEGLVQLEDPTRRLYSPGRVLLERPATYR